MGRLAAVLSGAVCLAPGPAASAQPMDTYGMGSRAVAMGGAVTADVEDFSANYYNPAGLVRGEHTRVAIGWMGVHHDLRIDGLDSHVDPVTGLVAGLVVPGRLGGLRFAFGLGLHLNDARVSRTRTLPRSRPRWEFYDNRPHRTFLATHLAIRPFDWLLVGGGISFLSYSSNRLSIRGDIDPFAPARTRLEHDFVANLTTIRYPQLGVQITPMPELSFGLVYRGQFSLDNELVATVGSPGPDSDTRIVVGDLDIPGYFSLVSESVNAFVPHQVSVGATVEPIPGLRVAVEVTWLNWSAYVSPIGRSDIRLDIEVPPELRDTIRVPERIEGSTPIPANFQDRFVPRLGVEGVAVREPALELRLRGGGFYESSPVPEQTSLSNLVDCDRIALSAGAGVRLTRLRPLIDGWIAFDLHVHTSILPERITRKASPVDLVGDWRASGWFFAAGLTAEVALR